MSSSATLRYWWWGEEEAPGLGGWLAKTIDAFQAENPDVRIDAEHEAMLDVVPRFTEAAAAGAPPDLQFLWNGIYHIENAWRGYLAPLDSLIPSDELDHMGATALSSFGGHCYRAGWYQIPVIWAVNRRILREAGVAEQDIPPQTWAQFLDQCERVRVAGQTPIVTGDRDGDFSVWWLTHFLVQQFDDPRDVAQLFLGGLDWRDEACHEHWRTLKQVWDAGYLNPDAPQLDLWAAFRRFCAGDGAFTLASGPMFADAVRSLGDDALVAVAPVTGPGKLAGLPIVDTQGLGIAQATAHPEAAAAFIRFMHQPKQLQRLWDEVSMLPANDTWTGGDCIDNAQFRKLWEWFRAGPSTLYIPDLMPVHFHFQGMAPIGKRIMAGEMDGAAAGAFAASVTREWSEGDPVEVAHYREWIDGLEI